MNIGKIKSITIQNLERKKKLSINACIMCRNVKTIDKNWGHHRDGRNKI